MVLTGAKKKSIQHGFQQRENSLLKKIASFFFFVSSSLMKNDESGVGCPAGLC